MQENICLTCGAGLDSKVDYELPDGSKRGRCSVCRRPYVISEESESKDPEPDPNPDLGLDPPEE